MCHVSKPMAAYKSTTYEKYVKSLLSHMWLMEKINIVSSHANL